MRELNKSKLSELPFTNILKERRYVYQIIKEMIVYREVID